MRAAAGGARERARARSRPGRHAGHGGSVKGVCVAGPGAPTHCMICSHCPPPPESVAVAAAGDCARSCCGHCPEPPAGALARACGTATVATSRTHADKRAITKVDRKERPRGCGRRTGSSLGSAGTSTHGPCRQAVALEGALARGPHCARLVSWSAGGGRLCRCKGVAPAMRHLKRM